ncbi:hypothetical protein KKF91_17930 [Myxococcota bacterium]|nr:hypothetical protein [Myxococcota bacterium]
MPQRARLATLTLTLALLAPAPAQAQLNNPDACSGVMIDMMTDGMVFMYLHTADLCFGMCDQAMGVFFMAVLESSSLTMEFMECAAANPELIDMMIRIIAHNPELLDRMASIIEQDCAFPAAFIDMASWHDDLRAFFFYVLNDRLYRALTRSMLCQPPFIVETLGEMMELDAAREMRRGRPFWEVYMNMGAPEHDADANEMADERMFYAFMSNPRAAASMFEALSTMGEAEQVAVLDFMFLGRTHTRDASQENPRQAFYNIYAITEAFMTGIAPLYDMNLPPDPRSANPANALLGQMLAILVEMDAQGQLIGFTPYAGSFFQALRSGAEVHCDPRCLGMMHFMASLFPLEVFARLPPADESAPSPRDYKRDGAPLHFECPAPACGLFAPMLCADEPSCLAAGLSWCGGSCLPVSQCPEMPCSPQAPDACLDIWSCFSVGLSWCNMSCQAAPCPASMPPDLGLAVDMGPMPDAALPPGQAQPGAGGDAGRDAGIAEEDPQPQDHGGEAGVLPAARLDGGMGGAARPEDGGQASPMCHAAPGRPRAWAPTLLLALGLLLRRRRRG